MSQSRPFGVTLLAILAGVAGVIAAYHMMQFLHILPFWLGPIGFYGVDIWSALLWGVLAVIYAWVVAMLWNMNQAGWLYVVIVASANLILALIDVIGGSSVSAMAPAFVINGLALLYCVLPSTRRAFGVSGRA